MACDASLAVMMNIAATDATAGSDADPGRTVPTHLAVLDRPSRAFGRLDRPILRNARIFLDRQIADQYVVRRAFECKDGDGRLDLAVTRIICEIDLAVGIVEIESVAPETVFT